jgi:hypothetical protein
VFMKAVLFVVGLVVALYVVFVFVLLIVNVRLSCAVSVCCIQM